MIKAKGNGQSECYECKKRGKWSLNWTSFLYRIEKDNYEHLYCYECAKKLEEEKPMLRIKELNFILTLILIALIIFNIVLFLKQLFVKEIINTVQTEQIKILEQSLNEQIQEKQVYMKMVEEKQ